MVTVKQIATVGFLIAIAGFFLNAHFSWGLFQFTPMQVYQGCDVKQSAGVALIPFYGYYSCEPSPTYQVKGNNGAWENAGKDWGLCKLTNVLYDKWASYVNCPNVYATTGPCDFKVKNEEGGFIQTYNVYYQICDSLTACGQLQTATVNGGQEQTLATGLAVGQGVRYFVCDEPGLTHSSIQAYETHINYGLFQYERGNKATVSTISCGIPSSANQCIDCKPTQEGDNSAIYNNPVPALVPNAYSTYLKDWVYGPLQANFVTDTDGQMVDCSMNKVYNLNTIQTELGCSAYAYSVKRTVTCCPGDKLGSQYCGSDFAWHGGDLGCIKGGIPSIVNCNGQGGWYNDGTSTTYQKATSCNSDGTCSYQTVSAPCAAPSIGCAPGQFCKIDVNNPANNICQGQGPCGDNNGDCLDDCTNQQLQNCGGGGGGNIELNWAIAFALIAGAFAFFTTGGIKKFKEKEYDGLGISSIYALIAGIATWWAVTNWMLIAATLGITVLLGGIGLYFFGATFIVIFAVIGKIIKAFKGD